MLRRGDAGDPHAEAALGRLNSTERPSRIELPLPDIDINIIPPIRLSFAAATLLFVRSNAQSDGCPSKRIEVVVPHSAGSGIDVLARVYAQTP